MITRQAAVWTGLPGWILLMDPAMPTVIDPVLGYGIAFSTYVGGPEWEEVSAVEIYPLMLQLLQIEAPAPAAGRGGLRSRLIGDD